MLFTYKDMKKTKNIYVIELDESVKTNKKFAKAQVLALKKDKLSLMPADLQKQMSAQELVDVVAYMATLKKAKK